MWKIKKYFLKYKGAFLAGFLCNALVNVFQLIPPELIRRAVNGLKKDRIDSSGLLLLGLLVVCSYVGVAFTRFGWRYFLLGTSCKVERDIRDDFYRHVIRLPAGFFMDRRTGDLMALSSNDMVAVRHALAFGLMTFADVIVYMVGALYMMFSIHPVVTLYVLLPLPVISVVFLVFGRVIHRLFAKVQESFASLTTRTEENITGIRVVRAYVQEKGEEDKFALANRDYREKNMRLVTLDGVFEALLHFLPSSSFAILVIVGGAKVVCGEMMIGDFIAMNMYLGILIWPMMAIGWVYNLIQRAGASIKRIWKVFDEPDEFEDIPSAGALDAPIEFRDLTFTYPGASTPALRGLTLRIGRHETVAVMGRTGSGKTTLVNVLTRLYDPPRGTVFVCGKDVLDIPKQELRVLFGVATQESFLFSDTISRNIAFAASGTGAEEIAAAARSARICDDIMDMPDKFDTVVGERGINLSGGQRQRTSIARALAARRRIVVFDDPLSAVDTVTERAILDNLRREKTGRTMLLITHRVNAARLADRIVVLDYGRVAEEGTEDDLLAAGGIYKDIFERQKLEAELEGDAP
jgi:ATP-binding cassette subfamily B protein